MLRNWQTEWDAATTRRFTYNLLPFVEERQLLSHLQDIDHRVAQLLKGHGLYKSYLVRFHRSETIICEHCGGTDEAIHLLLHCPTQKTYEMKSI